MTNYLNDALTDICKMLLDDWGFDATQIANLAADIPRECEAIEDSRNEAAWERQQQRLMESGSYRRDIISAGRGHLLK
jgi:hypothetical protein